MKPKIFVTAHAQYLPDQSIPELANYLWSYDVTIVNETDEIIQLLSRHWKITDKNGKVEEVRGPGVVGLQPLIKPGKQFSYTSYCQLPTTQGTMEGHYEMQNLEENLFVVEIPKVMLQPTNGNTVPSKSKLH